MCVYHMQDNATAHTEIFQSVVNKSKSSNPITGLGRPLGSQEVEAPRFFDNWHNQW
jgi:hypothetical protein